MKLIIGVLAAIALTYGLTAISIADSDANVGAAVSILQEAAVVQEAAADVQEAAADVQEGAAGAIQDADAATATQEPGQIDSPVPAEGESVMVSPSDLIMNEPIIGYQPVMASPPCPTCCQSTCCCQNNCCCPPPGPTPTTFCLVDPCGCSHEACINVPACCAGQQPVICWRNGIFKRQIATLSWECCGYQAQVIVTCRGKVRVRD